jgi:hypothetical protein
MRALQAWGVSSSDDLQSQIRLLWRYLGCLPCDELDVAAADAKVRQIVVVETFQLANRVAEDEPCSDLGENK